MNRLSFKVKRVFHRFVQLGVMMTRAYGLTPARFDLMLALECQRQKWVPHKDLRELLGVRSPTVSRMVTALVRKGLLVRRHDPEDSRRRQIGLTRFGRQVLRCAFQHIVKSGYMREVAGRAVSDSEDFSRATDEVRAARMEQVMSILGAMQSNLGDMSRFEHGDDGRWPLPIEPPIAIPYTDEEGNWPGDDPPVFAWVAENLPWPLRAWTTAA